MITIYTDGSCRHNGKIGGFGVVVTEDNKILQVFSAQCKDTTNNREELKAILWAMKNYNNVKIVSDSAYCVNLITDWMHRWKQDGWKRNGKYEVKNLDLIRHIYDLYNIGHYEFEHILGHNGNYFNELADALATGRKTIKDD